MSKAKCDKCGKMQRSRHMKFFHGELLCHNCFVKNANIIRVGSMSDGRPRIYDLPLTESVNTCLTVSQKQALSDRVATLPKSENAGTYVRNLILKDLGLGVKRE